MRRGRGARAALCALLLWAGASSVRAGETCCICQVGLQPAYQRGFFSKGCETWIREQTGCSSTAIIDAGTDPLPVESCKGGSLRLGYVGHWADVRETYDYYQRYIQPAMNRSEVSVYWDNTACNGLDKPDYFASMFKLEKDFLLKRRQIQLRTNEIRRMISGKSEDAPVDELPYAFRGDFVLKANQVRSIGMWDRFVGGSSANFWLLLDAQNDRATYPPCPEFEGKACWLGLQEGDRGRCMGDAGVLRTLACRAQRSPGDAGPSSGAWTDAGQAL